MLHARGGWIVLDAVIVGAGQAGLAMGYHLSRLNKNFIIIEKGERIGATWQNRYDSLVLFTPRALSSLPGLQMEGPPQGLPTKNEVADYLQLYAEIFSLPVHLKTEVLSVEKTGSSFKITTTEKAYSAKQIIVATGPFQSPAVPALSKKLSMEVQQLHSSEYKNTAQLKKGNVLVVGGGNSGAQIAVELAASKEVHFSVGKKPRFLPLSLFGKSIFWWFKRSGLLNARKNSVIGTKIRSNGDPIFGYELKRLIRNKKIILHSRTISCHGNMIVFQNQQKLNVQNVIWATGFSSSYDWLRIPEVFDSTGTPIHNRGITAVKGLYFLGLPWQHKRGSALLLGVGEDAEFLASQLDF